MIQGEMNGKGVQVPEFSSEAEENDDADNEEEDSGEEGDDGSSRSNDGDDGGVEASSERDDASLKVEVVSDVVIKKLVNSWVVIPSPNGCFVNFNMRRT
jgi:hypothetical protein